MMSHQVKSWLRCRGEAFFRRVGVRPGQCVLDFGCREGRYTFPAARVVGPQGCVYAVDKDTGVLRTLKRNIRKIGVDNIRVSRVAESGRLPAPPRTVNVAILYDVLHGGYFPEASQRIDLLGRIFTVIKPGGILSCYPTHLKRYGLTFRQIHREIRGAGFRLEAEAYRKLVHDDSFVRGRVFQYRKPRRRGARVKI